MDENTKVSIKNLTNHAVGFGCVNYPQHFNFQPGQVVPIKWEYVSDAAFDYGFRYMIENSYLKIMPNNQNYAEIMEELQFTHLMEKIEKSLSYEDIKAIFRIKPLSTQYSKIKKILKEGSETEKKNVAMAAIELKIKDYIVNTAIKEATNIDVIKALELQETPKVEEKSIKE